MINHRKEAIDYLESIQRKSLINRFGEEKFLKSFLNLRKAHKNMPWDKIISNNEMSCDELDEFKRQYESDLESAVIYTKFELRQSFTILKGLYETIEKTALRLSLDSNKKVFIGTAQSKFYGAYAVKVPKTSTYLTIIESELFTLSNQLAKLVASSLPNFKISEQAVSFDIDKENIAIHIIENNELQDRFADFVQKAIILSQPNQTRQYLLDKSFGKLHYALTNSLELFIVGHEYAHICLGHFEKGVVDKSKKIQLNWNMEFEADCLGFSLSINSLEEDHLYPFSILGPSLFFSFLDLKDRVKSFIEFGTEKRSPDNETHPPHSERKERLRLHLKKSIPSDAFEIYQSYSKFVENILMELWNNYKIKLKTHN